MVILYPQFDVIAAEMLEKDIFAISETYFDSSIDNSQIHHYEGIEIDMVVVSLCTYPITCTSSTEVILNQLILKSDGLMD